MTPIQSTLSSGRSVLAGDFIDSCRRMSCPSIEEGDFGIYYLLETNTQGVSKWPVARRNDCGYKLTIYSFASRVGATQYYSASVTGTAYPLDGISAMLAAIVKRWGYRETADLLESSPLQLTGKFTDFRYLFTYNLRTPK